MTGGGGVVTGRCVDVSDEAGVRQWVADTAAELGGLDIVVANVSALANLIFTEPLGRSLTARFRLIGNK